jgi:hypothetical protein
MISKDNIISRFKEGKFHFEDYSNKELVIPFDLLPDELLNRAINHFQQKNYEDALLNSKRAIECQMDCLLFSFGYYKYSKKKKWPFPKKMKVLADLGISTPRILGRINTVRNKIEHDYKSPEPEFVETALDVTELFSKYVEKYWKRFRIDVAIAFEDFEDFLLLDFNPSIGEFNIGYSECIGFHHNVINRFSIKVDDGIYFDFLKKYLNIYDEW